MRAVAVMLLAGCYHPVPPSGAPCSSDGHCPGELRCIHDLCVDPASDIDGPVAEDAPPDVDLTDAVVPCAMLSGQFDACALPTAPDLTLTTGAYAYNTDTHVLSPTATFTHVRVAGMAGPIELLVADKFWLGGAATLRVTGSVAFGIIANDARIDGAIDASDGGAGARSAVRCGVSAGQAAIADNGGGPGGGGGAFRGLGGTGGAGDSTSPTPGGAGGTSPPVPMGPIGGCPGGAGGLGVSGSGGVGAAAGGAVFVIAGAISVAGAIGTGGGGGAGGPLDDCGGGGGGSGGMIWLEASSIKITGTLASNGGGGGGGAGSSTAGQAGAKGRVDAMAAAGGAPGNAGSMGGSGAAGTTLDGTTVIAVPVGAGGAGGGGAGYVKLVGAPAIMPSAVISPPPS